MLATRTALFAAAAAVVFVSGFTATGVGQQPTSLANHDAGGFRSAECTRAESTAAVVHASFRAKCAGKHQSQSGSPQRAGAGLQPPRFDQAVQPTGFQDGGAAGGPNSQALIRPSQKYSSMPAGMPAGMPTGPIRDEFAAADARRNARSAEVHLASSRNAASRSEPHPLTE